MISQRFAANGSPDAPLFVPSGAQTGYKAVGGLTVPADGSVSATADFDVRKAVVDAGSYYKLKPTIRLLTDGTTGRIAGAITNLIAGDHIVVHAYEAGDYDAAEELPRFNENDFPGTVSSSNSVDTDGGQYVIAHLPDDILYDLIVVSYDTEGLPTFLGSVTGVAVQAGASTTVDIDLAAL